MDDQQVKYEALDGDLVLITLNRPEKLNAISTTVMEQLAAAFRRFQVSDAFAAILTGTGRAFCAGMDVAENFAAGRSTMQAPDLGESFNPFWPGEESDEDGPTLYSGRQRRLEKPVIAAVHGYACGGGFLMAMAADLCVVADDTVFEVSEVPRGLPSGWELGRLHGWPRHIAMELALGLRLSGRRAYELGLANRLVPREELLSTAIDLGRRLCAMPRSTLLTNRALVDALLPVLPEDIVARAGQERDHIVDSPEVKARFRHFAERHADPGGSDRRG